MALFHDLYDAVAARTPEAPGFVCCRPSRPRAECSFAGLVARSKALADGLRVALEASQSPGPSAAARAAGAVDVVALRLSRTHVDFLPAILAASRCGVTLAFLSTDLEDRALEDARAQLVLAELRPRLLVAEAASVGEAEALAASSCVQVSPVEHMGARQQGGGMGPMTCSGDQNTLPGVPLPPLCFLFTGGTTRGRCVAVTHDMVRHESLRYTECLRLPSDVRVLAQTSVYWGASALGQLSIALAYGGCAVMTEANEAEELRAVIDAESVDVLGIVPDQLRMLTEDPHVELPRMRAVFTWGEALRPALAELWRNHPGGARIRELLISTEYWLSLYAAPIDPGFGSEARLLRPVRGARVLVLGADGDPVKPGELGELLLAGPMVTCGYVQMSTGCASGGSPTRDGTTKDGGVAMCASKSPFLDVGKERYFRTGDMVRLSFASSLGHNTGGAGGVGGQLFGDTAYSNREEAVEAAAVATAAAGSRVLLEYRGRLDMTAKEKGKWIDLRDMEERVSGLAGVTDVALLPDRRGGAEAHACLTLDSSANSSTTLSDVRQVLPRSTQLHVLHCLPRHPVTRKIDLRRLRALTDVREPAATGVSWPMALSNGPPPRRAQGRLRAKVRRHAWTTVIALIAASAPLDVLAIARWRPGVSIFAIFRRPKVSGLAFLPLLHLACLHVLHMFPSGGHAVMERVPCGMWGAMFVALATRGGLRSRSIVRKACNCMFFLWVAFGAACAVGRRRLLSYQVAFWVGVGHRLDFDCSRWLRISMWREYIRRRITEAFVDLPRGSWDLAVSSMTKIVSHAKQLLLLAGREHAGIASTEGLLNERITHYGDSPKNLICKWSGRQICVEWPPPDLASHQVVPPLIAGGFLNGRGEAVCWQAWPVETAAALNEAKEFAARTFESTAEPGPEPSLCDGANVTEKRDDKNGVGGGGDGGERDGNLGPKSTRRPTSSQMAMYDNLWWQSVNHEKIDLSASEVEKLRSQVGLQNLTAEAATVPMDAKMRRLCRCVGEVVLGAAVAGPASTLHGLDSLAVALLTARLRREYGAWSLSAGAVRRAANIAELQDEVEAAKRGHASRAAPIARGSGNSRKNGGDEYALFFSPGQVFPMGAWVVRNDAAVHVGRMEEAARLLVDRHAALRTRHRDPLCLLSFCLDTAILFGMFSRRLDLGSWLSRALRRLISWALRTSWPRLTVLPRSKIYARHMAKAPFTVVAVHSQEELEAAVRDRRMILGEASEPVDITLLQLEVQLVGLWVYGRNGGQGEFAIIPNPSQKAGGGGLTMVDRDRKEAGILVGPGDSRWRQPPHGFPALFCGCLEPEGAGIVWLRLSRPRELVVLWKANDKPDTKWHRFQAYRMPGAPGILTTLSYVAVHAMHSIADGQSYEAIVGDLLALYASLSPATLAGEGGQIVAAEPPPAILDVGGLAELQRRLDANLDVVDPRALPQQCSLRGGAWRHRGRGYGHCLELQGGAAAALRLMAGMYGTPADGLLLALCAASIARASGSDVVPASLYVPNRDGPGEAGYVGLFSDWRDVEVGEDHWRNGERLRWAEVQQPLSITIDQQVCPQLPGGVRGLCEDAFAKGARRLPEQLL
eukprot:TRINITY_DN10250_c0_g1_i6.p1 TRINITY_DN10250_c0_g1~~TRINITY_DN10250_c0_g1_i6.p1  ORF type:complete len:1616 (+),score=268.28 TRINITY_DN10250_c0_g1_i6:71-4849(+)